MWEGAYILSILEQGAALATCENERLSNFRDENYLGEC